MMITAKKIQASKVTPIISKDVPLNTRTIRKIAVSTAVPTANRMTLIQLIFSPPYSLLIRPFTESPFLFFIAKLPFDSKLNPL